MAASKLSMMPEVSGSSTGACEVGQGSSVIEFTVPLEDQAPALGIDLGTTYSCIGTYDNGEVHLFPNEEGGFTVPSYVAFKGDTILYGNAAKNQAIHNPANTIYDSKRLMGLEYDDESLQDLYKAWPFKVVRDSEKRPVYEVTFKGEERHFSPIQIGGLILTELVRLAKKKLNGKIPYNVVITVPAYFKDYQRAATMEAAKLAGLNVIRLMTEPTAAAIAHSHFLKWKRPNDDKKYVLVYDLGGGTFDVTVMVSRTEGVYDVLATEGSVTLGGQDFTTNLAKFVQAAFEQQIGKKIPDGHKAILKIRRECEAAKRTLAASESVPIAIDYLYDDESLDLTVQRSQFEEINMDLFKETMTKVESALSAARIRKEQVHDVVVVGRSTKIVKIGQMLSEFFDGREISMTVDQDLAVCKGAAILAASLDPNNRRSVETFLDVTNVTPRSLGVEVSNGGFCVVVPKNSQVPDEYTKLYVTVNDNQDVITMNVYEGERPIAKDNSRLGKFTVTGLPRRPRGQVRIIVIFFIDDNGILKITAVEEGNRANRTGLVINASNTRNSSADIQRMLREAREFGGANHRYNLPMDNRGMLREADEEHQARIRLENYCDAMRASMQRGRHLILDFFGNDAIAPAMRKIEDASQWLRQNRNAVVSAIEDEMRELEEVMRPIITVINNARDAGIHHLAIPPGPETYLENLEAKSPGEVGEMNDD